MFFLNHYLFFLFWFHIRFQLSLGWTGQPCNKCEISDRVDWIDECIISPLCLKLTFCSSFLSQPRMDQYFNQMEKIVKERKTSSRIRFMLQDVIDLRLVSVVLNVSPVHVSFNSPTVIYFIKHSDLLVSGDNHPTWWIYWIRTHFQKNYTNL